MDAIVTATIAAMRLLDPHPFTNFLHTLREQLDDDAFRAAFTTLVALIVVATGFYAIVEGWSLLDSLYFAVIAAATVGFGDFAPQTDLGKVFTILYVLMSVGLLVALLSRIASGMIDRRIAQRDEEPRPRRRLRRRANASTPGPDDDTEGPEPSA